MRVCNISLGAAAAAVLVSAAVVAPGVSAAPGDQFILPIHHIDQQQNFAEVPGAGLNGSSGWQHQTNPGGGDIARVYWQLDVPGVPASAPARQYLVEWWDATPASSDAWQPIESQIRGSGGETYPMDSDIPWAGQFGTNHQWIGAEAQAIGGGQWRLAGPGPQAPVDETFNSPGNGYRMWLKSGSQLYAKWDFGFQIDRTWAELRVTEVPEPGALSLVALGAAGLLRRVRRRA